MYQAHYTIQASGEKIHVSPHLFSTLTEAESDAADIRIYEGTRSWVERIVEDGETPPAQGISKADADAYTKSQWWTKHPHEVVALAQARQERICMPFGLFKEACEHVLGEILTDSAFLSQKDLIDMLQRKLGAGV